MAEENVVQAGGPGATAAPAGAAPAADAQTVVTADQVGLMIEQATAGHVSGDQVLSMIEQATAGHVTGDQVQSLIDAMVQGLAASSGVAVAPPPPAPKAKGKIPAKYLAGLRYRTSKARKGGPSDDDSTVHALVERDLTPDDVLDWADLGNQISIVTADGQRVRVPKK